jgi:hypothetical protein
VFNQQYSISLILFNYPCIDHLCASVWSVIAVGGTALELAALVGIWHSVVHLAGSANLSKCQTLHVAPSATVPAVERSSSVSDISGVPLTMLKNTVDSAMVTEEEMLL